MWLSRSWSSLRPLCLSVSVPQHTSATQRMTTVVCSRHVIKCMHVVESSEEKSQMPISFYVFVPACLNYRTVISNMLCKILKRVLSKCKYVNSTNICEECSKVLWGYSIYNSAIILSVCVEIKDSVLAKAPGDMVFHCRDWEGKIIVSNLWNLCWQRLCL